MSFNTEAEMYPIIDKWLRLRDRNPCLKTIVDRYSFRFGTKRHRADILGVYLMEDRAKFVGIEAKRSARMSQTALRQAQALQSFCHEIYVAVPYNDFQNLKANDQEDLQNLISSSGMGLLLVRKRKIIEQVRSHPSTFRLDLHQRAEETIQRISPEDAERILAAFTSAGTVKRHSFLANEWRLYFRKGNLVSIDHLDDSEVEIGSIEFT